MTELDRIVASALADFASCADPAALENSKARYLGSKTRRVDSSHAFDGVHANRLHRCSDEADGPGSER